MYTDPAIRRLGVNTRKKCLLSKAWGKCEKVGAENSRNLSEGVVTSVNGATKF